MNRKLVHRQPASGERGSVVAGMISDNRLILVTSSGVLRNAVERGERVYVATYTTGAQVRFAVASAEHARTYAREYGMRLMDGAKPISVRWDR